VRHPVGVAAPGRLVRAGLSLSIVVLLADAGVLVQHGLRTRPGPPAPQATSAPAGPVRGLTQPDGVLTLAPSVPVALSIPSLRVTSGLTKLGLNTDRTVQVPVSYHEAGWYDLGPTPGSLGPAVILGHVDSKAGPGIFYRLGTLRPGAALTVTLADGATATFSVTAVAEYRKDVFPTQLIYGPLDYPGLRLVTCGGAFDARTGHYLSNIVAYARLTASTPPRTPPAA
jgi:hypothetical protein